MSNNISWNSIRPLNGDQKHGFEELCAQLARSHVEGRAAFTRKGAPDAGVECFATLPDGSEWGWQAKFFGSLGDTQWVQLDDSVTTALEKHPQLKKYFVCVPLDRPDARTEGRISALDKWNDRVSKWRGWALAKGMDVEFVWSGSSELISELAAPKHAGRLKFWFNATYMDDSWLNARRDEAIRSAGPRYTPEINVHVPISKAFDIFGRIPGTMDQVKKYSVSIREKLQRFGHYVNSIEDPELVKASESTLSAGKMAYEEIARLEHKPDEQFPMGVVLQALGGLSGLITGIQNRIHTIRRDEASSSQYSDSSRTGSSISRELENAVWDLNEVATAAADACAEFNELANSNLLLVTGDAGTGKTHVLCDVTKQRVEAGLPTLLLMGQQFRELRPPWDQALSLLDLRGSSVEEFVGALESLAQSKNARALLMIDAVNEGAGQDIWYHHLASFLAAIERSPWIGVVLSIRTGFEDYVLPDVVREKAAVRTHHGFTGQEFDAVKEYFTHYRLELPSTPLLSPEFSNPLFLKTLCEGLHRTGERRLPRGHIGVAWVFQLYIDSVNLHLARKYKLDASANLVGRAVHGICIEMAGNRRRTIDAEKAKAICDGLLPGRAGTVDSLYRQLCSEGLLVEWRIPQSTGFVAMIAYERFSDHLIAKALLDEHLVQEQPEVTFAPEGSLAFLAEPGGFASPGLLEAFFIQVPERCSRELPALIPALQEHWACRVPFRQSLVWREPTAFFDETFELLNSLIWNDSDFDETLDAVVSLAPVPNHPMNGNYLHGWLMEMRMPDRDSRWSIYLHRTWDTGGAVDRFVAWALTVQPERELDEESVVLSGVALAWMFTTANRFLRDKASKGLIALMTGRLGPMCALIDKFKDVDDPYVTERLYAAAYGVALRNSDPGNAKLLAETVFEQVFASGAPPIHVLTRDYARGVIERASHLCGENGLGLDLSLARPPYQSSWPTLPSDTEIEEIRALTAWSSGNSAAHDIWDSVMGSEDFARYVIGTNLDHRPWLSVPRSEGVWLNADERLDRAIQQLLPEEQSLFVAFKQAKAGAQEIVGGSLDRFLRQVKKNGDEVDADQEEDPELLAAEALVSDALSAMERGIAPERLESLLEALQADRQPPRFDLQIIQRYIVVRVFTLGWTKERFGSFDRGIHGHGREAHKAERIGKKYQWIAYHEIYALISDHYQFYDGYELSAQHEYHGPWQDSFRNLDPSHTLLALPQRTSFLTHDLSWWAPHEYTSWDDKADVRNWISQVADLPDVRRFLRVQDSDGVWWLNLGTHLGWERPIPPEFDRDEVEQRRLWYIFDALFVRRTELESVMDFAINHPLGGRWWPEPSHYWRAFLGEFGWAPADARLLENCWCESYRIPFQFIPAAEEYLQETGTFDCSIDETFSLLLPDSHLQRLMHIHWIGKAADYVDRAGRVVAKDPCAWSKGPSSLLIREDVLRELLSREDLALIWLLCGEKEAFGPGHGSNFLGELAIGGQYHLEASGISGDLRYSTNFGHCDD